MMNVGDAAVTARALVAQKAMTSRPNSGLGKAKRPSASGRQGSVKLWAGGIEAAANLERETQSSLQSRDSTESWEVADIVSPQQGQ